MRAWSWVDRKTIRQMSRIKVAPLWDDDDWEFFLDGSKGNVGVII
jgi:hypothetical protein